MKNIAKWIRGTSKKGASPSATNAAQTSEGKALPTDSILASDVYQSDAPVRTKDRDRFGRWHFAERIAGSIATQADPESLVIGIFGPWGDGKTSTLLMMQETLSAHRNVVTVSFNPWQFDSHSQLFSAFFTTLATSLGRKLKSQKEEIGEALEKYGGLLSALSASVGGVVGISPGKAAKELGTALANASLDELRQRIESILRDERVRVVVLIDDIDRLDKEETHAIFRLVKLTAGFQYTTYVLAFDDAMVAASLGERYGAGNAASGRSFLEKIIQVPLHLPPSDEVELRRFTFEAVERSLKQSSIELSREEGERFARYFIDGVSVIALRTPRQAKLYANALSFSLPMIVNEVCAADFMLIEAIRLFYPDLYSVIRDNRDEFVTARGDDRERHARIDALIQTGLKVLAITDADRRQIRSRLLEPLFPRISRIGYGNEWDDRWAKEKRVCSSDYFKRYFYYGVPLGDVGDAEIEALLSALDGNVTEARADELVGKILDDRRAARFISKLRRTEEAVPPAAASSLAPAIVRNGQKIASEGGTMFGGTSMQAGILVSRLLRQVPVAAERLAVGRSVLTSEASLSFQWECYRWIRHGEDRSEEDRIFAADDETALRNAFVDRIRDVAAKAPLYGQLSENAPALLWVWSQVDGAGEVGKVIESWLKIDDQQPALFLQSYLGRSWGMESGLSRPSDFQREQYNSVAQVISPNTVFERLREIYGAVLDTPEYRTSEDLPLGQRVAHQFAYIHHAVRNQEPR